MTPIIQDTFIALAIAAFVSILDILWQWPARYHPLHLFNLLADRMTKKVNHTQSSKLQHYVSGTLGCILIVVPNVLLVALILQAAEFPIFFDALILFIALEYQYVRKTGNKISLALAQNKKELARYQLQHIVLRETQTLSPLGMAKAHIESVLLRFSTQYVPTLFWFLLLGPIAAITYRLLYEFSQSWNTKHPRFKYFGQPVAILVNLLQGLPVGIAALCISFVEGNRNAWRGLSSNKAKHHKALAFMGGALGIQLGGPVIYAGQKVRTPKVGGAREVKHADIKRVTLATYKAQALLFTLTFFGITLWASF